MTVEQGSAMYGGPRFSPLVRVERIGSTFRIVSTPHPIHVATVMRTALPGGWIVRVKTAKVTPRDFPQGDMVQALQHAARMVGALYRVDMRDRFTGPQRFVMGRNLCPYKVSCPLGVECPQRQDPAAQHHHLCKKVPDGPLTVFCSEHTDYRDQPGDVFRSIDDSAGD